MLVVLTDRRLCRRAGRSLTATLAAAIEGGPFCLVIREKDLPRTERARLAVSAMELVRPHGCRVMLASDAALAHRIGADGVHLAASDPLPTLPVGTIGRSCHGAEDLRRAGRDGADYATISPVFLTESKPGYGPPLGLDGLESLAALSTVDVLALGGVSRSNAASCLAAGAAGVAVMREVMTAADPGQVVAELREALRTDGAVRVAQPHAPTPEARTA